MGKRSAILILNSKQRNYSYCGTCLYQFEYIYELKLSSHILNDQLSENVDQDVFHRILE